eukprot:43854_1
MDAVMYFPLYRDPHSDIALKCRAWSGFVNETQRGMYDIQFTFDDDNSYKISDSEWETNLSDLYVQMIRPLFGYNANELEDRMDEMRDDMDGYLNERSEFNLTQQTEFTQGTRLFQYFKNNYGKTPAFGWPVIKTKAYLESKGGYDEERASGEDIDFVQKVHRYSHLKVVNETLGVYCDGP